MCGPFKINLFENLFSFSLKFSSPDLMASPGKMRHFTNVAVSVLLMVLKMCCSAHQKQSLWLQPEALC